MSTIRMTRHALPGDQNGIKTDPLLWIGKDDPVVLSFSCSNEKSSDDKTVKAIPSFI
jgi:hypothetical protein